MKKMASISKLTFVAGISPLLLLSACGPSGPGPDIHDSKYVALGEDGIQLEAGQTGPCVLDQFTGLVWEVKTDLPGIHHRENTYSWFNPDEDASGELDFRGAPGAGKCSGSACDTFALAEEVNKAGYCGFNER